VSTFGENGKGELLATMGDRPKTKSTSTETIPPLISNAATQVLNGTESSVHPITVQSIKEERLTETMDNTSESPKLEAIFVRDTIPDGSKVPPSKVLTQTWTLYNPGPSSWPKGCSVRFVGGDGMFNVDMNHPSSVSSLISAMESTDLLTPVLPFGTADFTVTLKAPQRGGRAISYWRLKTPDGLAFGHKLWCDIDVRSSAAESQTQLPTEIVSTSSAVDIGKDTTTMSTKEADVGSEDTADKPLTESAMIFPKLDKESPLASTHEATSPAPLVCGQDERDLTEDVESLTLDDGETDDEFLTDEEYDILDASDQEFTAESQKPDHK
jgi:next-to-BRCA1 protein 1